MAAGPAVDEAVGPLAIGLIGLGLHVIGVDPALAVVSGDDDQSLPFVLAGTMPISLRNWMSRSMVRRETPYQSAAPSTNPA